MVQAELQCKQGASKRRLRNLQGSEIQDGDESNISSLQQKQQNPSTHHEGKEAALDQSSGSEACYKLKMLRAKHNILIEDYEESKASGRGDPQRERLLLQAACWQLNNEKSSGSEADQEDVTALELATLELAAISVAVSLSSSSPLPEELDGAIGCEVRTH